MNLWRNQKCLVSIIKASNSFYCLYSVGQGGTKVKSGVQWAASWLKPLGFSVVDQISEAATLESEVNRKTYILNLSKSLLHFRVNVNKDIKNVRKFH